MSDLPDSTYHLTHAGSLSAACGRPLGMGDGHSGVYARTLVSMSERGVTCCGQCLARVGQR